MRILATVIAWRGVEMCIHLAAATAAAMARAHVTLGAAATRQRHEGRAAVRARPCHAEQKVGGEFLSIKASRPCAKSLHHTTQKGASSGQDPQQRTEGSHSVRRRLASRGGSKSESCGANVNVALHAVQTARDGRDEIVRAGPWGVPPLPGKSPHQSNGSCWRAHYRALRELTAG